MRINGLVPKSAWALIQIEENVRSNKMKLFINLDEKEHPFFPPVSRIPGFKYQIRERGG
jgi:hypothetical protein